VEIPPLKRKRIMTEEYLCGSTVAKQSQIHQLEGTGSCGADIGQLVSRANSDSESDDESDDEDYEPSDDGKDEDMDEGLSCEGSQSELYNGVDDLSSEDPLLDDLPHDKMRIAAQELRQAFPKAPLSVCKSVLLCCGGDLGKAWESLTVGFKPSKPRKVVEEFLMNRDIQVFAGDAETNKFARKRRKISEGPTENPLCDNGDSSDIHSNSLVEYYDQHGLPSGSIAIGKVLSQMTKVVADMEVSNLNKNLDKSSLEAARNEGSESVASSDRSTAQNHVFSEENDLDESSDPDSDTSSKNSDDSSSAEFSADPRALDGVNSPESSESSDASSNSDSEPEEMSSKSNISTVQTSLNLNGSSQDRMLLEELPTVTKPLVPPGAGKNSTKKRNQRRRKTNAFRRFQRSGILPVGTTVNEFMQLDRNLINTPEDAVEAISDIRTASPILANGEEPRTSPEDSEIEARRRSLLAAVASGGVEAGLGSSSDLIDKDPVETEITGAKMTDTTIGGENVQSNTPLKPIAGGSTNINGPELPLPHEASLTTQLAPGGTVANESVSRPQRKVNVGAIGRLVFGALGVRTPRTKAEQEKVQDDLMKRARPSQHTSNVESIDNTAGLESEDDDREAWKKVINLRAVECCYDGIELSPAPFPFIQRWDPQQQGNYWQKDAKKKRNRRNQASLYEDEDEQQVSKKRKRNYDGSCDDFHDHQYSDAQVGTNENDDYPDNEAELHRHKAVETDRLCSDGVEGEVDEQLMRDVQEAVTNIHPPIDDDLQSLPENVNTLPDLSIEQVNTGMVIAFKQLVLSQATNWQPQLSDYLTAVVIKVLQHGLIELTLAKRDRDRPEKHYDELTGDRIYGKFDMPSDDEDDEEDDGFRSLTFDKLVEAKIVQEAPEILLPEVSIEASAHTSNDKCTTSVDEDSVDNPKASIEDGPQEETNTDRQGHSVENGNLQDIHQQSARKEPSAVDTEEILEIIKEAGFRSSVPSSITRSKSRLPTSPTSQISLYSPKFHSFGSSPPQIVTSPFKAQSMEPTPSPVGATQDQSKTDDVHYPQLSMPSFLDSQIEDHGHQPDFPSPGEDTLHAFDTHDSPSGAQTGEAVMEPDLPAAQPSSINEARSALPKPFSDADPPSSSGFPNLDEIFSTTRDSARPGQEAPRPLEPMTDVAREAKVAEEYNKAMDELDASLDEVDEPDQLIPKASKNHSRKQFKFPSDFPKIKSQTANSPKKSPAKKSRFAKSLIMNSKFVIPPGSQQVDLTLSSDEVEVQDDNDFDDDPSGLPSGPGWVDKKRKKRKSTPVRSASQPIPFKSRLARRKTTMRF
jgi:hypothetical protein